jgi:hypothetical protein
MARLIYKEENIMNKEELLKKEEIQGWKEWEKGGMTRCYLTLKGQNKSWAGDRNAKVYWDNQSNELVIQRGKGLTSEAFEKSLQSLAQ